MNKNCKNNKQSVSFGLKVNYIDNKNAGSYFYMQEKNSPLKYIKNFLYSAIIIPFISCVHVSHSQGLQDDSKVVKSVNHQEISGDIRIALHDGYTRFVVETQDETKIFIKDKNSQNPEKIDIVIENLPVSYFNIKDDSQTRSPFENISSFISKNNQTIIKAELKKNSKIIKAFEIAKSKTSGHRFVIDISTPENKDTIAVISDAINISDKVEEIRYNNYKLRDESDPKLSTVVMDGVLNEEALKLSRKTKKTTVVAYKNAKPVVVIDAGHGGTDPGAIGVKSGAREKDITIRYALLTYAKLKKLNKYDVRLTRTGDYTLDLKSRRNITAKYNADLFISIHADHHDNKNTRGLSVYTLSNESSDDVAKKLAESHSEGQIIGGIKFNEKDKALSNIIVDLERRKSSAESVRFSELMIKSMKHKKVKMLFKTHRFAGFAVLKGPDVPSALIEIGFLSNKYEEKLLNSTKHKQTVTDAIVDAVDVFFNTKK